MDCFVRERIGVVFGIAVAVVGRWGELCFVCAWRCIGGGGGMLTCGVGVLDTWLVIVLFEVMAFTSRLG